MKKWKKVQVLLLLICLVSGLCDKSIVFASQSYMASSAVSVENAETTAGTDTTNDGTEEPDYIIGRELTEKEIAKQKALEPTLKELPQDNMVIPSVENTNTNTNTNTSNRAWVASQATAAPTSYDSRAYGYITPVKNQNPYGNCWAFGAIGAAEASLIKKGAIVNGVQATAGNLDLSERHLNYFFYHSVTDPLGNTLGDKTENTSSDSYLQVGGNSDYTAFALADWIGMADESVAPYINSSTMPDLAPALAYQDAAHLQNAYWINMSDQQAVKEAIINYGAVAISYYHDASYYNYSTAAYYNNAIESINHVVTVVGWDDTYSAANFNSTPAGNGAWLVKNSWSSGWGNAGYLWISYYDKALTMSDAAALVFDSEAANNYDHNYQYDGSAVFAAYPVTSGGSISNIYKATGNQSGGNESLKAVSFALHDTNINYSIQIYKNLTNLSNPTSGTPMISGTKSGTTKYTGIYTIPLDNPITLEEGSTFSIVIQLTRVGGGSIYYFVDTDFDGGWVNFTNATEAGQSFYKNSAGGSWVDGNANGYTARIKAFTVDAGSQTFTLNANGGTSTTSSITANMGSAIGALPTPTRTGYDFLGWYTAASGGTKVTETTNTSDLSGITTLYAQWSLTTYTVTYYLDGGTNAPSNITTYTVNTPTYTLVNPERTGYTFAGWYTEASCLNGITTLAGGSTGNKTIYAKWTQVVDTTPPGDTTPPSDTNPPSEVNKFVFDGSYTYYLQADGTPMKDRMTYHPDGEHIIYFDVNGHELFNTFQYCPNVGYTCYFDSNGYLYKDKITFVNNKPYYLDNDGRMRQTGWFRFANGVDFGYANGDGTLMSSGFSYDPWGRVVFYHWNGMVARGLISDGVWYYSMSTTDGHYLGQFPVR